MPDAVRAAYLVSKPRTIALPATMGCILTKDIACSTAPQGTLPIPETGASLATTDALVVKHTHTNAPLAKFPTSFWTLTAFKAVLLVSSRADLIVSLVVQPALRAPVETIAHRVPLLLSSNPQSASTGALYHVLPIALPAFRILPTAPPA